MIVFLKKHKSGSLIAAETLEDVEYQVSICGELFKMSKYSKVDNKFSTITFKSAEGKKIIKWIKSNYSKIV